MEDNDIIICRCREVTKKQILEAIKDGAVDLAGVKRRVNAGMGLCQGKSCSRLVARIISEQTGISLSQIGPSSARPPVRPVNLQVLNTYGEE